MRSYENLLAINHSSQRDRHCSCAAGNVRRGFKYRTGVTVERINGAGEGWGGGGVSLVSGSDGEVVMALVVVIVVMVIGAGWWRWWWWW